MGPVFAAVNPAPFINLSILMTENVGLLRIESAFEGSTGRSPDPGKGYRAAGATRQELGGRAEHLSLKGDSDA